VNCFWQLATSLFSVKLPICNGHSLFTSHPFLGHFWIKPNSAFHSPLKTRRNQSRSFFLFLLSNKFPIPDFRTSTLVVEHTIIPSFNYQSLRNIQVVIKRYMHKVLRILIVRASFCSPFRLIWRPILIACKSCTVSCTINVTPFFAASIQ